LHTVGTKWIPDLQLGRASGNVSREEEKEYKGVLGETMV